MIAAVASRRCATIVYILQPYALLSFAVKVSTDSECDGDRIKGVAR